MAHCKDRRRVHRIMDFWGHDGNEERNPRGASEQIYAVVFQRIIRGREKKGRYLSGLRNLNFLQFKGALVYLHYSGRVVVQDQEPQTVSRLCFPSCVTLNKFLSLSDP